MPEENQRVSGDAIWQSITAEASGFYNVLLTTASGFLGGTLIFVEKIAPSPVWWSIILLAFGWLLLIACIGLTAWIRWQNIESGRHVLEDNPDISRRLDKRKECLTKISICCLILGMFCLAAFGCINLVRDLYVEKEHAMPNESDASSHERSNQVPAGDSVQKYSIPYGSLKPQQPTPQKPSSQPPKDTGDNSNNTESGQSQNKPANKSN